MNRRACTPLVRVRSWLYELGEPYTLTAAEAEAVKQHFAMLRGRRRGDPIRNYRRGLFAGVLVGVTAGGALVGFALWIGVLQGQL